MFSQKKKNRKKNLNSHFIYSSGLITKTCQVLNSLCFLIFSRNAKKKKKNRSNLIHLAGVPIKRERKKEIAHKEDNIRL